MPDAPLFLSPDRDTPADDRPAFAPAVPGGRPTMPVAPAELHDTFLAPNGVDGWIPEHAEIVIEDGRITFPRWRHLDGTVGGWGKDVAIASDRWTDEQRWAPRAADDPAGGAPDVEMHTGPLVASVTDRVRELFRLCELRLVER